MNVYYRDPDYPKKLVEVELPDDTPQDILDEVLAFLEDDYRYIRRVKERERSHREFSLDALAFENSSIADRDTPEKNMIRMEEQLEHDRMMDKLTETQQRRLLMLADGMSLRDIARIERVDVSSVAESIRGARKKIKKLF